MLQGNVISEVLYGPPHILNSPTTTTRLRSTYVLQERTLVVLLAAFKLMESLCVCVDVLPIGRLLDSLRPPF